MHFEAEGQPAEKEKVLEDNGKEFNEWIPKMQGTDGETKCRVSTFNMGGPCASVEDVMNLMVKHTQESSEEEEDD